MLPLIGTQIHWKRDNQFSKETYPIIGIEAWDKDNWTNLTLPKDVEGFFNNEKYTNNINQRHRAIIKTPLKDQSTHPWIKQLFIFPHSYAICTKPCKMCP
jgi:hypothetical protein